MNPRLDKFLLEICNHPYYKKTAQKITEAEFDFVVDFLEDNSELDNDAFTLKVNRLFMDGGRPKHHSDINDLLLASRVA